MNSPEECFVLFFLKKESKWDFNNRRWISLLNTAYEVYVRALLEAWTRLMST
jgi:hypothetical protein